MTIIEKIKANARLHPERSAIISMHKGMKTILTWRDLDAFSDKLASFIKSTANTSKPIIVYGHKHPFMVVCFLACVKSGRAYCPIDVNVPLSRAQAIIDEVEPEVVFATEELGVSDERILTLETINRLINDTENCIEEFDYVNADDIFYIIFTSGSTGTPKGVQITRDCLDNFLKWAITLGNGFDDGTHRVFLNQAPFSFDLSVMDLYLCLYTGGTLWTLNKDDQTNMKDLYKSLNESNANVWVSTPSFADVCLSDPVFSEELMPDLTDFLFCGEVLTNKTVERLEKRFPSAKIVNTYGPTESTCAVTEVIVTHEINMSCTPLPVGRPKPRTWIRIKNEQGNDLPDGEKGEIVIVGNSVSPGYWNNAEKNKAAFGMTKVDGRKYRFYRTGDEGYILDGMLYYGGRIDNQVKLHGYRIELEDIENNLLKVDGITQAVVLPKYRNGKVASLIAGVVSANEIEDVKKAEHGIKETLKQSLPEYMIPKRIKFLSDMPRTNNGKIDRKATSEIL